MCVSTESAIETRIKSLSGHNIGASSGAARKMQHGAVGNLDGEMLAKFALAVPWRASISAHSHAHNE